MDIFKLKNLGIFAGGVLFGTAGVKLLSSRDAKKAYTSCTAAVLRVKDCVMTDYVIVGILIILIVIGIRSSVKHFKGEGGCCGGGSSVKVKRKKLKQVVKERTVIIEGMTCEHCKARAESRLNSLDGVSAKVNLKRKTAVVSMEKEVEDEEIKKAIENVGYEVIEIR